MVKRIFQRLELVGYTSVSVTRGEVCAVGTALHKLSIGDGTMKNLVKRLWANEDGAAMVEYALLVALIALVAIVGVTATGTGINAQFSKISCKITTPSADCQ